MNDRPSDVGGASANKLITSADNAFFKKLRDCLTSRGIGKHGLFMNFGARAVSDLLELYPDRVDCLLAAQDMTLPRRSNTRAVILSPALFKELDTFGTRQPILVMQTPQLARTDLIEPAKGLEIVCALGDPANVGALLRSAAAFSAARVILLKESASPFHPRAVRAASSTTLTTPLVSGPSILEITEKSMLALDMNGLPIDRFRWPENARLLIGQEGLGVPDSSSFTRLSIPMRTSVESLNATVAASIALYAYRTQRS